MEWVDNFIIFLKVYFFFYGIFDIGIERVIN